METIVQAAFWAVVAWACYKTGKQLGSRKGFHAGRRRGRFSRR